MLHAHRCAVGAAGGRAVVGVIPHDLLDNHLIARQARAAGNHGTGKAAAEAQHHRADACQHAQGDFFAVARLFGGLLRGAAVAVAVIAAVTAIAAIAAKAAGVAVVLLGRGVRGGKIRLRRIGGVHTAAAHIGVAVLWLFRLLRLLGLLGLLGILRGCISVCMVIKTGVIIFVTHTDASFLVFMLTVYRQIVK